MGSAGRLGHHKATTRKDELIGNWQMASSAEVMTELINSPPSASHPIAYNFLVPNMRGFENYIKTAQEAPSLSGKPSNTQHEKDSPASNTSSQDPNAMPSRTTPLADEDDEIQSSNTSSQDPNQMPSQKPVEGNVKDGRYEATSSPFTTEISIFAAATETFSKTNTNCSIAESVERFKKIIAAAKEHKVRVRGYVSVALGCPYEGPDVPPQQVADLTASLLSLGVDEVSVADTTGMGTAPRTEKLLKALSAAGIQMQDIALHFHDTYGMALVNTLVGLEHGVRVFDSSVGGLGGCPFSKGATGNVATEDLVYTLHSVGMQTGIDLKKMAEIGEWISGEIGKGNEARAGKAMLARLRD